MKLLKLILLMLASAFTYKSAASQNVLINILTQNSGIVDKGRTAFLQVTVNNTDPASYIGVYKIKTQISVPSEIVSIDTSGHILPSGWKIISNDGSTINLTNGKDLIAAHDARTILIAIRGNKIGGPSTIAAQLSFSDGTPPGTAPGILKDENPGDNSSTSTIKVLR